MPMDATPSTPATDPDLNELVAEQTTTAREQLSAAWQLHVDRVAEQLNAGWREDIERVLAERMAELQERSREVLAREVALAETAARRATAETLNQTARRLAAAESSADWTEIVLDAAGAESPRVAVLFAGPDGYRLEGARNLARALTEAIARDRAPAIEAVCESRDTVVCARTAGELSGEFIEALGGGSGGRAYLFPINDHEKTAAVLYAEPATAAPVTGLELLAAVAGLALVTLRARKAKTEAAGLVGLAPPAPAAEPGWIAMPPGEQDLHLRAQRFARVQVAEMQLYKAAAVRAGRVSGDLYSALKDEIELAREAFRVQFLDASPTMIDYLHLELVKTLAQNDAARLGSGYPGPLA